MPLTVTITGMTREPNNGRVLLDYQINGATPNGKEFSNQASAIEWVRSGIDDADESEIAFLAELLVKIRVFRAHRSGQNLGSLIGKAITFDPLGNPIMGVA